MSASLEVVADKVKDIRLHVENNSNRIDEIVSDIIQPYCAELDQFVKYVDDIIRKEEPPTDEQLDDFILNLSTCIYFASGAVENLGIRDDISKAVYKEMYHSSRATIDKGTVADKDSLAELASQQEYVINVCYNRAWRLLKSKVESAQELLGSCKKVLTRRMTEAELTRMNIH